MDVVLVNITPLSICDRAIGMCWDKQKDEVDTARMDRVINKFKHESTVEHIVVNYEIYGLSRLVLQELARHRMASLSVKSSRYTLTELKAEKPFVVYENGVPMVGAFDLERASKYVNLIDDDMVNIATIQALENVRYLVASGKSLDKVKYALPEGYATKLSYTINFRSLRNLLKLRTDKSAHFEFRELANKLFDLIPDDYRFLLEDFVYEEAKEETE